jgi:hypothetical protein
MKVFHSRTYKKDTVFHGIHIFTYMDSNSLFIQSTFNTMYNSKIPNTARWLPDRRNVMIEKQEEWEAITRRAEIKHIQLKKVHNPSKNPSRLTSRAPTVPCRQVNPQVIWTSTKAQLLVLAKIIPIIFQNLTTVLSSSTKSFRDFKKCRTKWWQKDNWIRRKK